MKKGAHIFATVAAIFCVGLAFAIVSADPSHAATLDYGLLSKSAGLHHVFEASPVLLGLRAQLADITTRAEAKRAEITDDMDEAAVRAIETAHAAILAEAVPVQADIARLENEQRNAPPVTTDPQTVAAEAVRAERERSNAIEELASRSGFADFGREHVRSGTTVDAFRSLLLDHMVSNERNAPTDSRVNVIRDEGDTRRSAQIEALAYGLGAPTPDAGPSQAARQFMGMGLVDLAAESVNYRGRRMMNARDIDDVFTRASHSTSDFPVIFEGAVNRTLEQRYALAQPTFKRFARKRNFRDFRPDTTVKVGDFPLLKKVLENGEIKYGSFGEGKEQVQAFSYAIALNISRQMLINDDLGAISELLTSYGASVALFEEVTFYAGAFNGNLADGKTVYHAEHKNLAGTASAITVDAVGEGRKAMSKQKSIDGNPLLSNAARIMLVGPDKLTEAEKFLASITPATVATVNIFSGKFELIETNQIEGNAWHLLADPASGSNYRWGYLEGYEAPRVRMDEPFGRQGFSMSVEHDFGCGATDYRFGYKNAGA
ncbi:phage major capsid protein [Ochrobactrum chromiisoli]|uniref:Bacteriophage Mu GpT domain-containing protein n=1 Tax=Ochrobactrum chromiisoli TaxID=2993941 RepID=A0ABT3QL94_9HYPH|nr:hypothetical protein [Ochrobactrum chromiisoli]MCX2696386.1 hypothetical protein [Ochrobactrum chromiisoli]